ncbi:hypothetical protein K3495_g4393 [Podosphaera aphanis]|nr:hypothetical protein K3495_g4393 [Podosphaera aphanis]
MSTSYPSLKVPDLKKLLQERGLVVSGNKAELISRLQEDDKKAGNDIAGEDEIDWDEDDKTTTITPTITLTSSTVVQEASKKVEVPINIDIQQPSITVETMVVEDIPQVTENSTILPATGSDKASEVQKQEFTIGLEQSDALKEAEKRAARAKRFGIPQDEEAIKRAERAKKFGTLVKDQVVETLDTALPDRRPKRTREHRPNSRPGKRQAPNTRRNHDRQRDTIERAKAEARSKRFARPVAA